MKRDRYFWIGGLVGVVTGLAGVLMSGVALAKEEINVYSYRQPHLIEPMLNMFTAETGIKVNTVYAKKGMIERLKAEGKNSPADLALTVDVSRLAALKQAGLLQSVKSELLELNIPQNLRDPEGEWFALTQRARVIMAAKDRVPEGAITSYEQLAAPDLGYKICMRKGNHAYNISLISSMVSALGREGAKEWLKGVNNNLGRKPQGNDRAQVGGVNSGECDLAIANTYYFGKMFTGNGGKNPEQIAWAKGVNVIFPNQDDRGAHINISGVGLLKYAPNRSNAIRLMEWLAGDMAQYMYANENHEFPVKGGVPTSPLVTKYLSGGQFKADSVSLAKIADYSKTASELVAEVNFGS
ncbi:MAG: extracellular solute-binding protein [Gammaproteobacteria bacterium]|uniref:Extracellular solute-binding protein n=1 Tax=Candidatus Thiopontia autotrophica TaxID=2841688 RepID=A0A8J6P564_9GAMM|nr:extracellular solute-binding protein [Candidatus Thiopontia autotrophica]